MLVKYVLKHGSWFELVYTGPSCWLVSVHQQIMVLTKYISVFNIDNDMKCLEQQINTEDWNNGCWKEINYILKYIQIENSNIKL